jgi:hypothetical protein
MVRKVSLIGRKRLLLQSRGPRLFQRVTLQSGLLARETRLFLRQKRYAKALAYFLKCYSLAWEYRIRFGMLRGQFFRLLFAGAAFRGMRIAVQFRLFDNSGIWIGTELLHRQISA